MSKKVKVEKCPVAFNYADRERFTCKPEISSSYNEDLISTGTFHQKYEQYDK